MKDVIDYQKWIKIGSPLCIVDAETDGLYGSFLSIAAIVTDRLHHVIEVFYGERDLSGCEVQDNWTKENVVPLMDQKLIFETEQDLLNAFWTFWMGYQERAYCMADVSYPVEARLFSRCVGLDTTERTFKAPFPLLDLSTCLLMAGMDPLADREKLLSEEDFLKPHHALNDVMNTARIWQMLSERSGAEADFKERS